MNYQLLMYAETHAGAADNWFNWIFVNEVWRGMLGMETLPALLFFVIVFFIPESPRWLIVRNREERAVNILEHIYSSSKEALVQLNETKSVLTSEIPIRVVLAFVAGYYETHYYWCMYSHPRTVYGSECSLVLWSFHL